MVSDDVNDPISALTSRWWVLVLRGVAAILFGILAFGAPTSGLLALVLVWGIYALADGVLAVTHSAQRGRSGERWGWLFFEGLVGIAAGILTFTRPGLTAMALLIVIAVWAIVTGVAEIATAIRVRRYIRGEWMLALTGVLSIAFGVLLLAFPGSGALALVWLIGTYAIVFGALMIGLGLRMHRLQREGERHMPPGGMRTPA
jgi:uncharacterized membrane protein HdeD (DUF308 family)